LVEKILTSYYNAFTPYNRPKQPGVNEAVKSFYDLQKDIDRLDTLQQSLFVGGLCPTLRRLGSLPDSIKEDNMARAAMLTGLAALHLPTDVTQMALAMRETPHLPEFFGKKNHQRAINFFKGTFMERFFSKTWLDKVDKTLFETNIGRKINSLFNIQLAEKDGLVNVKKIFKGASHIQAASITGNSAQKIIGSSLLRIPVIGLVISTALEIPAVIKAATKTDGTFQDKTKATGLQLAKSIGFIALSTALIAAGGAALLPYGILAEFAGMAAGSTLGIIASKSLNKTLDNIFKNKEAEKNPFSASLHT